MDLKHTSVQTLEQLDGEHWGEEPDDTPLVRDCLRLRQVQIGQLSDDDLRLLLGQKIGTEWLVPLALQRLADEPLAGDLYPGDLLNAVLHAGEGYWEDHPSETMSLWIVKDTLEALTRDMEKLLDDPRWPAFG